MNPLYIFPPVIAFIFNMGLFFLALRKNWKSFLHRIFGLFLLNMALWALFILCYRLSPDIERAYIWQTVVSIVGYGTGIFFYHFTMALTNIRQPKWFLIVGYLSWIVFAVLGASGFLSNGVTIRFYGYAAISTPLLGLYIVSMYFFVLVGLYNLFRSFRTTTSNQERNQVAYVIAGVVFSLLGGISDLLPIMGLPLYPMGIIGNILFCLLAAISILRYHLLDVQFVVRKSLAYIMTSTIVAIPYILIILFFNYIFGIGNIPVWAHAALLLLLALLVPVLWQRAQHSVDRVFFRERYDFLHQLEVFSQETHDISDLNRLSNSMVKLIRQALQIASVQLLLLNENGDFVTVASIGDEGDELVLHGQSPLIKWFRSYNSILNKKQLDGMPSWQAMPMLEKNALENTGVEWIIPLQTIEDNTIGLFILGKKLSEQPYTDDDKRLIATVASRVSIELENARLYSAEMSTRLTLQRQNDQKTEFLHTIAHELKTPLTSLIAAIELMIDEPDITGAQKQRLINILKSSTSAMDRRVSELLVLSKMQTGDLELSIAPLDINIFLVDIASHLTILFDQKEQELSLEIDKAQSIVNADKDRLEQIIFNLITNAIKYSPLHSNIILRAKTEDGKVVIEVEDSAPLIDSEEIKKLFDPYYRGQDTDEKDHLIGLGLGLYLVKRLVELHNGQIWISSREGKGNIFAFSLQVADESAEDN
ncbi:ATP-binding protein [Chloroflexota bacterium]